MLVTFPDNSTAEFSEGTIQIPLLVADTTTVLIGATESCRLVVEKPEGALGTVILTDGVSPITTTDAYIATYVNGCPLMSQAMLADFAAHVYA